MKDWTLKAMETRFAGIEKDTNEQKENSHRGTGTRRVFDRIYRMDRIGSRKVRSKGRKK